MDACEASKTILTRDAGLVVSDWRPEHVAAIRPGPARTIPLIRAADVKRLAPDRDIWDAWPVQRPDGSVPRFDGVAVWMALSAPVLGDPALRHQHARIRLLSEVEGAFTDCGPALPDGFNPGISEWSGSATLQAPGDRVELHFTATGRRGEVFTHEQRLFAATARLIWRDGRPELQGWSAPVETVSARASWRRAADGGPMPPGFILGLRDPALFLDPASGAEYLLYTASLADGPVLFGGAIGVAVRDADGSWRDLGPLVRASELNHELERPHIVHVDGRYYLFWSTQEKMFKPDGPKGPTGLYAMVGDRALGPYTPVEGGGVVAANPAEAPAQTYAWWVTGAGEAWGFIDQWGVSGRSHAEIAADPRAFFGGAIAPRLRLALQGARAELAEPSN